MLTPDDSPLNSQIYRMIRKKQPPVTLEVLLASIPEDFEYPSDVRDFVDSPPIGQELI
jgi:antitoxin MazE